MAPAAVSSESSVPSVLNIATSGEIAPAAAMEFVLSSL